MVTVAVVCLHQSWFVTYEVWDSSFLLLRVYSKPIWDCSIKGLGMTTHLELNYEYMCTIKMLECTVLLVTKMFKKFMLSNYWLSCLCDSEVWQLAMLFASPCLCHLLMEYMGHGKQIMRMSWVWTQFWALVKYKQLGMWWWNTIWHLSTLLLPWTPFQWTR